MRDDQRRGWSTVPGSCCLSATGVRFSGHPFPAGDLGLPCGRLTGHEIVTGPHRGLHVPHVRDSTGVGASCIPGTVVLTRSTRKPRPAPAASLRLVPAPRSDLSLIHISEPTRQAEISYAVFC